MLMAFFGLVLPQMLSYTTTTPPAAILIEIGWLLVFVELLVSIGAGIYRLLETRRTAARLTMLEGGAGAAALQWRRDSFGKQARLCFQHLAIWAFIAFLGPTFASTPGNLVLWFTLVFDILFGALVLADLFEIYRAGERYYHQLAPGRLEEEIEHAHRTYRFTGTNLVWLFVVALIWERVDTLAWVSVVIAGIAIWLLAHAAVPFYFAWRRRRLRHLEASQ
jgi:hypothetical protein